MFFCHRKQISALRLLMDLIIDKRSALMLYGSETGNASDFAFETGGLVERLHFSTDVIQLDAVEPVR